MDSSRIKNTYTIEEVAEIAKVNSFTLRNWEDRYQLFQPARDINGRRIFSELETLRAMCAAELVKRDYKIGKVAADFLNAKDPCDVLSAQVESEYFLELRDSSLKELLQYNPVAVNMAFDYLIANFKLEFLADHFFYPLFRQIEELKLNKTVSNFQAAYANQHLATRLNRLIGFIQVNIRIKNGKKIVLAGLPANAYEDSLLILYLMLERNGWDVFYGGKQMSTSEYAEVVKSTSANVILLVGNNLSITDYEREETNLKALNVPVIIGGKLALNLLASGRTPPDNIEWSQLRPGPLTRLIGFKLS